MPAIVPIHVVRTQTQPGTVVPTEGIVTSVGRQGFYLQEPGAGASQPGRAIYVFTRDSPDRSIRVGSHVQVTGRYTEFREREAAPTSYATPQLAATQPGDVQVVSQGNALPPALELDPSGGPLDEKFFRDHFGERVRAELTVVQASNQFGDFYGLPGQHVPGEPGLTERGGLADGSSFMPVGVKLRTADERVSVGARLGVEGPISHRYDFQVRAEQVFDVRPSTLQPETTMLEGSEHALSVAVYNLENLDPKVEDASLVAGRKDVDDDVGSGKYDRLVRHITQNLKTPDILAVQEMQDSDGAERTQRVDARQTAQVLIDAVYRATGVRYEYVDVPPAPNTSGGQEGSNIRVGYFYRTDRVSLEGQARAVGAGNPAFADSRLPLEACFVFRHGGRADRIDLFNLHKSSMRVHVDKDGKLVDRSQDRIEQGREAHRQAVAAKQRLPGAVVFQGGDFNAPANDPSVLAHGGDGFTAVADTERHDADYSHYYAGRPSRLDHAYVYLPRGVTLRAQTVHVNADFAPGPTSSHASDHDPRVYLFDFSNAA